MRKVLNNRVLLLVVAILLLSNIAMLFFFVWMKEPSKKGIRGERQKSPITLFLEQQVGFNKQQMEAYDKIRQQHRQEMKPLFEEIRLSKVGFYGLLSKSENSNDDLNKAASAIGEKQKIVDLQAFQNFKEIRALCTPEQQPRYDSLIAGVIANMWFPARKGNMHQNADSLHRKP